MSKWDLATDRKLLLTIIEVTSPSALPWAEITAKMGEGFTKEAVRQHFAKLKRGGESNPTTPVAPKAVKKAAKSKQTDDSPSAGRKRKRSVAVVTPDNEDDDSEAEVGVKKAKKEEFEGRRGSIIKVEEVLDNGTVNLDEDSLYD
ncbi:MAG: hypothetical protein Q9187_000853 [Circinaria calcarea]